MTLGVPTSLQLHWAVKQFVQCVTATHTHWWIATSLGATNLREVGKFCSFCSCVHLICRLVCLVGSLIFDCLQGFYLRLQVSERKVYHISSALSYQYVPILLPPSLEPTSAFVTYNSNENWRKRPHGRSCFLCILNHINYLYPSISHSKHTCTQCRWAILGLFKFSSLPPSSFDHLQHIKWWKRQRFVSNVNVCLDRQKEEGISSWGNVLHMCACVCVFTLN